MVPAVDLTSDVVAGGTALGGLLLVYLGGVTVSYAGYERTAQNAVRARHQRKAWFSVIGLLFALLATVAAVLGKWLDVPCLSVAAVVGLLIAAAWGCVIAILSAKEIA